MEPAQSDRIQITLGALIRMPKRLVHRRAARYLERMDARLKEQLVAKLELLTSRPSRCNNTRNSTFGG